MAAAGQTENCGRAWTDDVDDLLQNETELDNKSLAVVDDRTFKSIVAASDAEQVVEQSLLVRSLDRLCDTHTVERSHVHGTNWNNPHSRSHQHFSCDLELWPVIFTYEMTGQNEPSCKISKSKVDLFESYHPDSYTHTHTRTHTHTHNRPIALHSH